MKIILSMKIKFLLKIYINIYVIASIGIYFKKVGPSPNISY